MISELSTRLKMHLGYMAEELEHASRGRRALEARIQQLHRLSAGLPTIRPEALPRGRAGFGSTVILEDLLTGEALSYTLMSGDALDLEAGEISLESPVGHKLLGRGVEEVVEVITPRGVRRFRVVALATLFDLLEAETPEIEFA